MLCERGTVTELHPDAIKVSASNRMKSNTNLCIGKVDGATRLVLKEGNEIGTRQAVVDLPELEDGGERGELTAPEHKVSSVRPGGMGRHQES